MEIGKFCYIYFEAEGGPNGDGNEKFDKYWEAEVIKKNEDNTYTFKYTNGEIVTKKLGNPITTVNGNEAPEIFTEDEYFDGMFDISNEVYDFAEDFRQEWLADRYQLGAAPDPVGANIYYIYVAIEGGFDWYWQAKKDGEVSITRGNKIDTIHKFTYTGVENPTTVYVLDSSAQITTTKGGQARMIISAAEYFNGTFNIYNGDKYNFREDFKKKWDDEQVVWLKSYYSKRTLYDPDFYYYTHELRDGSDWYWEATKTKQGGDIIEFTSADGSKSTYVKDDIFTDMVLGSEGIPVRQIFSQDEYFGGDAFNIYDTVSYNFTPGFITAYDIAQEAYNEAVALEAIPPMSGGNVKLRF